MTSGGAAQTIRRMLSVDPEEFGFGVAVIRGGIFLFTVQAISRLRDSQPKSEAFRLCGFRCVAGSIETQTKNVEEKNE